MKIFPPPLEIGEEEGFSAEKDLFGRSQLGVGLANLLGRVTDPTVLAVDGQWGSGKSTFLKMWAGHLRINGYPVVSYDAFENDYVGDAFTSIASELIALLKIEKAADQGKAKKFTEKAIGVGKVLLRSGLKIGVKVGTAGALDAEGLKAIASDVAGEASGLADKYIGDRLTRQEEDKASISAFRDALTEIPRILRPDTERPLIFIIDELDRCRPHFALEILERIKHFFNVPNVHFVLGVHIGQLENSVRSVYGPDIDANLYLQKFIHLIYSLEARARHRDDRAVTKYARYLASSMQFESQDRELVEYATVIISYIAHRRQLSFRSIERVFICLALCLAFSSSRMFRPPPIIVGLCIIRVVSPTLFAKAKVGLLRYEEAAELLFLDSSLPEDERLNWDWVRGWWQFAMRSDFPEEEIRRYAGGLFQYNIDDRLDIVALVASAIVERLQENV